MAFEIAAHLDDIWSGDMVSCQVGRHRVLLVRFGDAVHAYEDSCPHLGVPLSQGLLSGTRLVCGAHLWEYDAERGVGTNPPTACLVRFPVRIEGGRVFVDAEGR
jgi:toluene monooxygenase system ferredoxin subunit